ncbi:hypothetical protein D3C85_1124460 [compost metagenome]
MSAIALKPRAESFSVGLMKLPAALLIRPSSPPCSVQMPSIIASTASASRMSTACACAWPPYLARKAAAASSTTDSRRPHRCTAAPKEANCSAIA